MTQHFNFFQYFLLAAIVFHVIAFPLQAQYSVKDIDSLEKRLNTPSLTVDELYGTYQALIAAHQHTDREKALEYVQKGLLLAEKSKNYYYFTELYFNAATMHYYLNQLDSSLYYFEKALAMHAQWADKGYHKEDLD